MNLRFLFFGPGAAAGLLALAACGSPGPGDPCNTTQVLCSDSSNALSCYAGKWLTTPCQGPTGCVEVSGAAVCDDSRSPIGTPCVPSHNLKLACSTTGTALVQCTGGLWRTQSECTVCASPGGVPVCTQDEGHPGGTEDGGTPPDGGIPSTDGGTDPCQGVPVGGHCVSSTQLEFCSVPTGSSQPHVATLSCGTGTACEESAGKAKCVQTAACLEGETRCNGASTLQHCQSGNWVSQSCPDGCSASALGAFCKTSGMVAWSGKVTYEAKGPNAGLTDWNATPVAYPGQGLLVLSMSGQTLNSASVTDAQGNFTVQVPASPQQGDGVVVTTVGADATGKLLYMVASPNLGQGTFAPGTTINSPQLWVWGSAVSALPANHELKIQLANGSAAVSVFDNLRYVWSYTQSRYGQTGLPLIVWLDFDTTWDCGACFSDTPVTAFSTPFAGQIWMSGGSDEGYWSDAVIEHELGHWSMASYGTSPLEGGTHILGQPTFPGLAWSEGWATFFSSDARNSPYYYDKQSGSMFWVDLSQRQYSSAGAFTRPSPSSGLIQFMDENEVSAMLWELRNSGSGAPASIFSALSSAKMNTSPWARGYTRHTWQLTSNGSFTNVVDTGLPRPFVADFLDTLMCNGFSATAMNAATDPTTAYPYPSQAPLCQ